MNTFKRFTLIACLMAFVVTGFAKEDSVKLGTRTTVNLEKWNVWIDKEAKWKDDKLYLPGQEDFTKMPVNAPTCGWDKLLSSATKSCILPATLEELFSEGKQTWTFKGVCWYVRDFEVPAKWEGKRVRLAFEQTRQRAELYINGKLCGYDLVSETPWTADITEHLKVGEKNQIAVRITNASGGGRGWEDYLLMKWGEYKIPHSNDFTGIGGRVHVIATDQTFIEDVFVKNLLPANSRNIEVNITLNKEAAETTKGSIIIVEDGKKRALFTEKIKIEKGSKTHSVKLTVEKAKLWDIDTPNLYNCHVTLDGKDTEDEYLQMFGFRTVELTDKGNGGNFYINGKRVRFRSAIDWGMYRGGGQYASLVQAKRSIANVKAIGHNALNFHRKIGLPRVMEEADRQGVYLYEEPGGFHTKDKGRTVEETDMTRKLMMEKVRRMMIRNRNHPSIVQVCLANEDDDFPPMRQEALRMVNKLNDSVFIYNSSGWIAEPNIRPYSSNIQTNFYDEHTVKSDSRFNDNELVYWMHRKHKRLDGKKMKEFPFYWGEVRCYCGPANYYLLHEQALADPRGTGYDFNLNKELHGKIKKAFTEWNLSDTGSKQIKEPVDVTSQMGRGLMYIDGRLSQKIMTTDYQDGYAINGWSQGPRMRDPWMSAICDEGRNLKGPAEDYAVWCRPLQVAIIRQGGQVVNAGESTKFLVTVINEGILPAGDYTLKLHITDGKGNKTDWSKTASVKIEGGDVHAQDIFKKLDVLASTDWQPGCITMHGQLIDASGKVVADGAENILLRNRASYKPALSKLKGAVAGWPAAKTAIEDAGGTLVDIDSGKLDYVLVGITETIKYGKRPHWKKPRPVLSRTPHPEAVNAADNVLKAAKNGATAIIQFDEGWAKILYEKKILSEPVKEWGGRLAGHWKAQTYGYIDHFVGNQYVSTKSTIGCNYWGIPSDPKGFYPFKSENKTRVYGIFIKEHNQLLALLGEIEYGKGRILLAPSYPVDHNHAFSDLLFFNMILMK